MLETVCLLLDVIRKEHIEFGSENVSNIGYLKIREKYVNDAYKMFLKKPRNTKKKMNFVVNLALAVLLGFASVVSAETYLGWVDYEDYCINAKCDGKEERNYKVGFEIAFANEQLDIIYIILDTFNENNVNRGVVNFPEYLNEDETAQLFPKSEGVQTILGDWEDENGMGEILLFSDDDWQNLEVVMVFEGNETNYFSLKLDETASCCDLKKWIRAQGTFRL